MSPATLNMHTDTHSHILMADQEGDEDRTSTEVEIGQRVKDDQRPKLMFLLLRLSVLLLSSLCILLAVSLINVLAKSRDSDLCLSRDCIETASVILSSMDFNVNPCDDFYQFACGNWIRNHPIPDDSSSISNFENLGRDLELALKELLETKYETSEDGEAVKKAKQFYRLCLNETAILDTWRGVFDEIMTEFDGWPTLIDRSFIPTISTERLFGIMVAKFRGDFLFKTTVQPDDKNSSRHILLFDQPTLNLFSRDFYVLSETQEERRAYQTLLRDVLVLLNAQPQLASDDSELILEFETDLANVHATVYYGLSPLSFLLPITMTDDQRHDVAELYLKLTLGEIRRRLPHFDWSLFIDTLFVGIRRPDGSKTQLNDDTEIVIYGIEFFDRFDVLLPKYPKRTIVNYMAWCWFFKTMLRDLPDPFALTMFKFYRTLNLMQVPKLRWHGCVSRINGLMPMATSSIYARNHFNEDAKKQVEEMIELIMGAFIELLDSEDWLTKETKDFAKEKIHAMNQKIGYPDYLNDSKRVDKDYESYVSTVGNYYKTKFQFYEMSQQDIIKRINVPVDRDRWVAGAAVVNAFYSPNTNEIIFPAAILQPVFYGTHFPSSMNFGGIGVVIGHEITHGFDDRGRLYDKLGNIRQWWDNSTIKNFKKKAMCIEKQYSGYVLDQVNMTINGKNTKGENIADNGGLKQAFRAYKKYEARHPELTNMVGVNLTHDQLFFLNYAQIWCGSMNDKEAIRKLRTSEHCPGSIRVKGPLSNSHDFAKAYYCPLGSPMNPPEEQRCSVW